jgi:hypothetical protein
VPVNEAEEILALGLIFVVHVAGGVMLLLGLLDADTRPGWWPRRRRRGDDGTGGPDDGPRRAPPHSARPLPLPGAVPSRARLRDEVPLRDAYPPPPRRSPREPTPERVPQHR